MKLYQTVHALYEALIIQDKYPYFQYSHDIIIIIVYTEKHYTCVISEQLMVLFCLEKIFTLSEQSFTLQCFTTLRSHRVSAKNQYTTLTDS